MVNIGGVIKEIRIKKNLTQEVVSGLAGIDRAHLARIELGEYVPQVNTFMRIAEALGMRPSELMAKIEEEK